MKQSNINVFSKSDYFLVIVIYIGGSRNFFMGGAQGKLICMCADCIAVKTQLLR